MASTRANALHHRDQEGEVDLVGTPAARAGPDQLPENAIHRVAIGDSQRVRRQLFAEIRIRMVDGESVRREFYSRGCGSFGRVGRGIVVGSVRSAAVFMWRFPGTRAASARSGHAQAIVRRGKPVQFQWWVRILPQS